MRQGKNLVSNSDFNRKRGEEYLISSSFASENIIGGGQLRSNNYSASSRSYKGGEGNYASLMSSDFAGTETMLNPDHIVGGGRNPFGFAPIQKGGKPLFRLASYTRNDLQKGGAGLTVCTPFHYEGGVC